MLALEFSMSQGRAWNRNTNFFNFTLIWMSFVLLANLSLPTPPPYLTESETVIKPRAIPKLLPKRLIVVFGLENSGTRFVYKTLSKSLNLTREEGDENLNSDGSIHVQHVPLPTGPPANLKADTGKNDSYSYISPLVTLPVVSLFAPLLCSQPIRRRPRVAPSDCQNAFNTTHLMPMPPRYFVNITSHISWYRSQGVQVQAVLVLRDATMHFKGIVDTHYPNISTATKQFEQGRQIVLDAVRASKSMSHHNLSATIAIVSYETLMTLQQPYLQQIYRQLGIESSFRPKYRNGNIKHFKMTPSTIKDKLSRDDGDIHFAHTSLSNRYWHLVGDFS